MLNKTQVGGLCLLVFSLSYAVMTFMAEGEAAEAAGVGEKLRGPKVKGLQVGMSLPHATDVMNGLIEKGVLKPPVFEIPLVSPPAPDAVSLSRAPRAPFREAPMVEEPNDHALLEHARAAGVEPVSVIKADCVCCYREKCMHYAYPRYSVVDDQLFPKDNTANVAITGSNAGLVTGIWFSQEVFDALSMSDEAFVQALMQKYDIPKMERSELDDKPMYSYSFPDGVDVTVYMGGLELSASSSSAPSFD